MREWYLTLPTDVRQSWSDRAITGDPTYAAAIESLTGRKADTVRTEYLAKIRRELGDGQQAKG